MAFFENISLALGNLRSNKMRSLLTMLGIIIGIAAVIAIETIGNSMTGAVTDSMSGLGVSNITVSLTQKTESDQSAMSGVQLRLFMDSTPSDGDLLTDEMIAEYTAAFPTQVADVQKTVTGGSATLDKYGDPTTTITASVSGVNRAVLDDLENDTPLLAGRWLRDDDGDRRICVVSEKFVQQTMGCTNAEAVGRQVTPDHQQYALYFLRGRRLHLRRYQQLNVRHGGRRRHPDQPLHSRWIPPAPSPAMPTATRPLRCRWQTGWTSTAL